ncbi:PD-(D/E)XK nuclease family protein [Saccharibacillus endophyticus]|uniref:PD-(D/E)XK nuclease family protein n=1 Tax=Saccharibacillus endophyticus TaxID=2060666 RepID=A0ABQ1ZSE5_9BACL|nr:PD-(D/E)XK nuclease family protein [Saccharibacillus endophyticus]GGH76717.1 hypothetical protein GCM10007362_19380 [Saccharibacillus endophyticus]
MSPNFINIVGYQFERVHTGMIAWLLDWTNPLVTPRQKYEILSRIYSAANQAVPFELSDIHSIVCKPEHSFGRRRKIDLVVKIALREQSPKYLVMEMKVDSIPYKEQLSGTIEDFSQTEGFAENDALFLLLLFGSSQVCIQPELYSFHVLRLPQIMDVFANLNVPYYAYTEWLDSLQEENSRSHRLEQKIKLAPSMKLNEEENEYWRGQGYRLWFPLFYYIYDELKRHSSTNDQWEIYSGGNNPVMNWNPGWLAKQINGYPVHFYWEFNYQDFILKVKIDEKNRLPQSDLSTLRQTVVQLCQQNLPYSGRQTQNRSGLYNSIYKWSFDFKHQEFEHIMREVNHILNTIHPLLASSPFP